MLHEVRIPYGTIKSWVLEAYYDLCRDRGVLSGRSHAEILGGVVYEYDETFERPIERLMLEVVHIVLNGGWYAYPMSYHREKAQRIMEEHGLENLLAVVPQEEAEAFKHDLKVLKLIPE